MKPLAKFTHGASGYGNYGCRCTTCRKGWAEQKARYRLAHPEYADRARERERQRYHGTVPPATATEVCPSCGRTFVSLAMHLARIARLAREGKQVSCDFVGTSRYTAHLEELHVVASRADRNSAILKAHRDGVPPTVISEAAGLSRQRVHQIVSGE